MSGSHLTKEFFDLVKAIGESKSKQEEDRIVVEEVGKLKKQLNDSKLSSKKLKEFLIRMLYVEMLGHDASFGYIKAVELTASPNLLEKRVGYLAACLCLSPENEFRIMLVNRLQQDMQSTNVLEICAGLTAATKLATNDMIPALLPLAEEKCLKHEQAIVRKKAIMLLHRFYQLDKTAITHLNEQLRRCLCDTDPSVMGASLHLFYDMAVEDPESYKDLVPSFVSILKQITELRLPNDYNYHKMPAPWIQMRLLRILATLGHGDKNSSEQMYEVLLEVMRRADTGINIGYAVVYECVRTVTSIYPNPTLLDAAASSIGRFISNENHNLKYLGVTGLASIVKDHPKYANEHQLTVIDCLQDTDDTLKRRTLDLLYQMVNPVNVEVIIDKLLEHLDASDDSYLRADLVERISQAAERFAPSNTWYIQTMTSVFELGGDLVKPEMAHNLIRLIAEGTGEDEEADKELRVEAVETYLDLIDRPQLSDTLLQVLFWVLGEYGYLSDSQSLTEITKNVVKLTSRQSLSSSTRSYGVTALSKLTAQLGKVLPEVQKLADKYYCSKDVDLAQRCAEFKALSARMDVAREVLPVDASCEDIEVDKDLSFLNTYVNNALSAGAKPYSPPQDVDQGVTMLPSAKSSAKQQLKVDAYEAPDTQNFTIPSEPVVEQSQESHEGGGELKFDDVAGPWGEQGWVGSKKHEKEEPSRSPEATEAAASKRPWDYASSIEESSGPWGANDSSKQPQEEPGEPPSHADEGTANSAPVEPPKPPELSEKEKEAQALFGGISGNSTAASMRTSRAKARERRRTTRAPPAPQGSTRNTPPQGSSQDAEPDILGLDFDVGTQQPQAVSQPQAVAPTRTVDVTSVPTPQSLIVSLGVEGAVRYPQESHELLLTENSSAVSVGYHKYYSEHCLAIVFSVANSGSEPTGDLSLQCAAPSFLKATLHGVQGNGSTASLGTLDSGEHTTCAFRFTLCNAPHSSELQCSLSLRGRRVSEKIPLPIIDIIRPAKMGTPYFGNLWQQQFMAHQATDTFPSRISSPDEFMDAATKKLHLYPVEMIKQTSEAIAAGKLMDSRDDSTSALLHVRISGGTLGVTVKTADKGYADAVMRCVRQQLSS
eukprot:gb/GECG01011490.1/.p1 GENE.gb/GECG01011490.1/~~gb/GECG01011490.1/.p1  ORF type:complete len:1111 (+),score=162.69 gb/GECG01011490.1/:1-3333(+)